MVEQWTLQQVLILVVGAPLAIGGFIAYLWWAGSGRD